MSVSDDLKKAIRESGLSQSELARRAGIARVAVSRFLNDGDDHRDIRLEATADKVAAFFGLRLVGTGKSKAAKLAKKAKPAKKKATKKKTRRPRP